MKNDNYIEFWLEKPEESVGFILWQITNLWQRKMNNALKEIELTHVQFVLLAGVAWLERFEKPITQVQLSNHAKTNIMMTSKVVRTLEEKGLIIRRECQGDTRAKCLILTTNGHKKVEKAINIVRNVDEEFFKDKTYDIEFIKKLENILEPNEVAR